MRAALRFAQQTLGPLEVAVMGVGVRREQPQGALLRPQLHGRFEDEERRHHLVHLAVRPEQSHRRLARPLAETPEPVRQERQRGVGLFEKSRRGEIGAGQVFLLVVQTGGEPIQFSGAGELTLVPQHVGDEVKRVRLGRTGAQHAFEQAQRFGMLARVGAQFPGVFLPEERVGTFALAKFFEPPDSLAAAGQFAQAG